jgi:hypothetical protein
VEVGAEFVADVLGRLAFEVPQFVDAAALHGHADPDLAHGAPQPGVAIDDAATGPSTRASRPSRHPFHASYDSPPHRSNSTSTFCPSARTPTTAQTGTRTTLPSLRTRSARASR